MNRFYEQGARDALELVGVKTSSYRPALGSLRSALMDAAHAAPRLPEGGMTALPKSLAPKLPNASPGRAQMFQDFMPPGKFTQPADPLTALKMRAKSNI